MLAVLLFILAALALLLVPGPSVLYIVSQSMAQGRRGGLLSVVGIDTATLTHAVAAAFGLSAILASSALAFDAVKFAGAAYLILLGIRALVSKQGANYLVADVGFSRKRPSKLFAQGYVVNLLNPKTALFFYAFLPQFVVPSEGGAIEQTLTLGLVFVALALSTDCMYALTVSTAGRWLPRKGGRIFTRQKYVTGTTYIALGMIAATASSKHLTILKPTT
ncbi:MAG TPA: LysE family translocator [Candidatus Acidoferrales bacterium]|nr:LysE family translocator [Candidatus Acidoferrales bacterium]